MKIAAVGAGRMGRGIALAFAYAGHEVALVDLKRRDDWHQLRADAIAEMRASLATLAELGAMAADAVPRIMHRIRLYAEPEADVLRHAEIIFEAVPETLEAKGSAFARICELAAPDAVLASTTSTILVTDLVPLVTRPKRLLNAHWLNPAYLIPLVELSVHPRTSAEVVDKVRRLLEDAGLYRAAPAGADHERGRPDGGGGRGERRGHRQGDALRPGAPLRRHRRHRVHRLRRQRHPLLCERLSLEDGECRALHGAAKRAKIDARGASGPEDRPGLL